MSYEIGFKPSALREIRKLDESTRQGIISEIYLQITHAQMVVKS